MEFIETYNLTGLIIGICTFLIIGLFHPVVIKAEYYWGTGCWWIFLVLGIVGTVAALWVTNVLWSSLPFLLSGRSRRFSSRKNECVKGGFLKTQREKLEKNKFVIYDKKALALWVEITESKNHKSRN